MVGQTTKRCQSGHVPTSAEPASADPLDALGLDAAMTIHSSISGGVAGFGTIEIDDIDALLTAAVANPTPKQALGMLVDLLPVGVDSAASVELGSRRVPKKSPGDRFEVILSARAAQQMEMVGEGAQKALDRIVGAEYGEIKSIGRRLPDRNGRQFWRVRTGVVAVLFDLDRDEIFVHGFAPRDKPPH